MFFVLYRPPPPPVAAVAADMSAAAANGTGIEIPAAVEQPPTSTANETTVAATGPPVLDVKTNPELPSPARVRWMDAFSRVCAHLNQVRVIIIIIIIIINNLLVRA